MSFLTPASPEYRALGYDFIDSDVFMIAERLKEYDPKLYLLPPEFSESKLYYEVYRMMPDKNLVKVHTCANEDGSPRHPDPRDYEAVVSKDAWSRNRQSREERERLKQAAKEAELARLKDEAKEIIGDVARAVMIGSGHPMRASMYVSDAERKQSGAKKK